VVELDVAKKQRTQQAEHYVATSTRGIDMDAIICLDLAHQWRLVEHDKTFPNTLTQNTRVKLCMVCGSLKVEMTNWRGYVVNRTYKSDKNYIENSRKLSSEVNERRAVYRRLIMGRPPKNVCQKCWLVHDSADCPVDPEFR
jgi:hypothetical protein